MSFYEAQMLAIYKKRMSYNKYNRCKNKQNWEIYRKQRNLVNKIKKQSIRNYFIERCAGGPKSKQYAEFTLSHLSTIEFKFFCSKSFKKNSWSKFLKLLYSTNFLFILGIVPLI
jgi:aromatic ring-opening dioxygenase LigB subunit